ncbi:hypothetical protein M2128_001273 [Polynucleobacter sphagniphilus]|nr:hypothetical protein [Polynucleobacter sphagniphilus]MDH6302352.1 hypothetical protein [Polynucleobacter sphagniphilus]
MNAPFLFAWKKLLIYQQEIASNKKPPEGGFGKTGGRGVHK